MRFAILLLSVSMSCLAACSGDSDLSPRPLPRGALRLTFEEISLPGPPLAPTALVAVPGEPSSFLVLEKTGRIHYLRVDGSTATSLGSVDLAEIDSSSDCGLLSLAFDPDWATNHFVFIGSCVSPTHSRIMRHVFDPADVASLARNPVEILRVGDPRAPQPWHNVGSLGFDETGALWAVFGDKRLDSEAQDLSNELGSLVRIVPSRDPAGRGAEPAPDNAFAQDGDPATNGNVVAWGLRSPWKALRDHLGRWFIGDVGESAYEEINVYAPGDSVRNFGWPQYEGPCEGDCANVLQPVISWGRGRSQFAVDDPESPMGVTKRVAWVGLEYTVGAAGDRYEGRFTNRVVYGDFCMGWVRALELDADRTVRYEAPVAHLEGVSGWAQGGDGYAYVLTYGNCHAFPLLPGKLFRAHLAPEASTVP